jgi:hypothetical protein
MALKGECRNHDSKINVVVDFNSSKILDTLIRIEYEQLISQDGSNHKITQSEAVCEAVEGTCSASRRTIEKACFRTYHTNASTPNLIAKVNNLCFQQHRTELI